LLPQLPTTSQQGRSVTMPRQQTRARHPDRGAARWQDAMGLPGAS